ncbi:MAG: hypothetical protein ACM336_11145 [Acidobacteriota bacterium]
MMKADKASVIWDADKKLWRVRIQMGEEVIKRPCSGRKVSRDAGDDALRAAAIETARADGYEVDPGAVAIER